MRVSSHHLANPKKLDYILRWCYPQWFQVPSSTLLSSYRFRLHLSHHDRWFRGRYMNWRVQACLLFETTRWPCRYLSPIRWLHDCNNMPTDWLKAHGFFRRICILGATVLYHLELASYRMGTDCNLVVLCNWWHLLRTGQWRSRYI